MEAAVAQPETFDLQSVFLALNGAGRATSLPGEDFMARLGQAPADMAYLVGVYPMTADWPHWEMHPKGCEVLVMLDGLLEMTLDHDGAMSTVMMNPGSTLTIPPGAWHTARVLQPGKLLGITYGEDTQHRSL